MRATCTIILSFTYFFLFAQQQRPLDLNKSPEYVKKAIQLGRECIVNGKMDCSSLYKEAIKKSQKENPECTGTLYGHLMNYFYQTGQDDSIFVYKDVAIKISLKKKENYNLSATYNLVAAAFMSGSNTDSALYYFQKARDYIQLIDNQPLLGENYSNTGGVYTDLKEYGKAKTNYLKGYEILKNTNVDVLTLTVLYNLAENAFSRKEFKESWKWIETAQPYLKKIDKLNEYRPLINKLISRLYLKEEKYDSAIFYIDKSIDELKLLADKEYLAAAYESKAMILKKQSKNQEALETINLAISLNQELNNIKPLANCYGIAAELAYEAKDYQSSADNYIKLLDINDSILSENKIFSVQEVREKYETEKKEKQIAEQELKIQKQRTNLLFAILGGALLISVLGGIFISHRKSQKLKLKQLQQEKENAILNSFILGEERERNRISQELHDGVAAMIGAAKMSLESIPHLSEEKGMEQISKVKKILENTHADVRHIAHNLLPTVLEKEGLIKATTHFAFEINETKLVKISVKDNTNNSQKLSPQLQLMLFRVIQELVNNIIKHSQAQNAEITFSNSLNGLQIEISDDGIGYNDTNTTENQGLYSITQRLKSIGGNFKIMKRKSGGTQAEVMVTV